VGKFKTRVAASAKGPAHSGTLARKSPGRDGPNGPGLRRPAAAFDPGCRL